MVETEDVQKWMREQMKVVGNAKIMVAVANYDTSMAERFNVVFWSSEGDPHIGVFPGKGEGSGSKLEIALKRASKDYQSDK